MKIISNKIPEIYLQDISVDDANQTYMGWLNDPLINQYLETRFYQQDMTAIKAFIKSMIDNPNEHLFTIRKTDDHRHVGNIKIAVINSTHNIGEVSLFIGDKSVWGKGYATKSIKLISRYAIEHLKLRKLSAGAYKPNIASTKAFLKAGYTKDGVLRNHYLLNNVPCDLIEVCMFSYQESQLPTIITENIHL